MIGNRALADKLKVRLLERPLASDPDLQQQEALEIGRKLNASFVLRAIPLTQGHQCWLTTIDRADFNPEIDMGPLANHQIGNIASTPLPLDVVLIGRIALAFALAKEEHYDEAVLHLQAVLNGKLPAGSPFPNLLFFKLGNWLMAQQHQDRTTLVRQAIQAYETASRRMTPEFNKTAWAQVMGSLGIAYQRLPGQRRYAADDPDLRKSLDYLAKSLVIWNKSTCPFEWAKVQYLRGDALRELATPDHVANLYEALDCYDSALEILKPNGRSREWARLMARKGRTYSLLARPTEALDSFGHALTVLTRKRYPNDWAIVQYNLGLYYLSDPTPNRAENAENAILHFQQAREFGESSAPGSEFETVPRQWLATAYKRLEQAKADVKSGERPMR